MHLAQRIRDFASPQPGGNSALYHRRALDIAEDPAVLAPIARLPTISRWISRERMGVPAWLSGAPPEQDSDTARMVLALDEVVPVYAGPHGRSLDRFAPA